MFRIFWYWVGTKLSPRMTSTYSPNSQVESFHWSPFIDGFDHIMATCRLKPAIATQQWAQQFLVNFYRKDEYII